MSKLKTKLAIGRRIAATLIVVLPVVGFAQTTSACKALVQIENNLWLVRANGTPIAQVTNDKQFRTAAALNPSGKVIAYSGKDAPKDLTLIDSTGRLIADVNLQAAQALTGLTWLSPTLLRAAEHLGRNASHFHFVRLGAGNAVSTVPAPDADGSSCALSPDGKDRACIVADSVKLNGRDIYYSTDAFASSTVVQTVDVAVGTGITTTTSPAFRVDVKDISTDIIYLRITTPDGLWTEMHVPTGYVMNAQFGGYTENPDPLFGVLPVRTTNTGVVRLFVKRSDTGTFALEGGIAWDPRGKRMAVVEVNPRTNKRTWILLNREMGQAATGANGAIDAKQPLPIEGPVTSIAFTSDTHLRIEGASQVFEKDIPAQGKVPAGGTHAITQAMPQFLTVKIGADNAFAPVKGWSCQ